jgi:hypothetical protein
MREFGDDLKQLHGLSGFLPRCSEGQLGGVAPVDGSKLSGCLDQEGEVNGMPTPRPLRRAPGVFKRFAVHVCEILRPVADSAPKAGLGRWLPSGIPSAGSGGTVVARGAIAQ